jgi:hypothetical protein
VTVPAQRVLVQTTIPFAENDWHVGRFSLLVQTLRGLGHEVATRDRETPARIDDPVLAQLSRDRFDQLWLIAVDTGEGITPAECAAIASFREAGGAVFVTRDHMDLGSSVCSLGGIGAAHHFHSKQLPDEAERVPDDLVTTAISWPNFHSGSNGAVQTIEPTFPVHPVLLRPDGSTIRTLPSHPHEGAVSAPPSDPTARVIATGTSEVTGRRFNIAVAFEPEGVAGRGWAESTFHHFTDYNWDIRLGCPSFVTEPPSDAILRDPSLLNDTKTYVTNLVAWLGGGTPAAPE